VLAFSWGPFFNCNMTIIIFLGKRKSGTGA